MSQPRKFLNKSSLGFFKESKYQSKRPKPLNHPLILSQKEEAKDSYCPKVDSFIEHCYLLIEQDKPDELTNKLDEAFETLEDINDVILNDYPNSILGRIHQLPTQEAQPFLDGLYRLQIGFFRGFELYFSIIYHQIERVKSMLSPDHLNDGVVKNFTALDIASECGFIDLIEIIVALAKQSSTQLKPGCALAMAARNSRLLAVEQLLKLFPYREYSLDNYGMEALCWTIPNNDPHMAKILLEAKANPDLRIKGMQPVLYEALKHCEYDTVELLLTHKANPDAKVDQNAAITIADCANLTSRFNEGLEGYEYPEEVRNCFRKKT